MTTLEQRAQNAWIAWGNYAKHTICHVCGVAAYCRSKHGKKFVCVECFDQGHDK
jgi:hypothetical protein